MPDIKATIDGKSVTVPEGTTILEAARKLGIEDIPTLCHDERLSPYGSCFLCVVEVEGRDNLLPSCASPLMENMVVKTDSEKIREARKAALELLVSNHYADCIAPCKIACPSSVDVQGYIALIAAGEYGKAVELVKETNPMVATCGRVCTRPCEDECRRNLVDERVGIDYLKRFASDMDEKSGAPYHSEPGEKKSGKVAIVGAGPAGLSCAYYLAENGYHAEIYESKPDPGGMLRYGIPEYRLPKDEVLDVEVSRVTELGVDIHYEKTLGVDFTIGDLKKDFDAVFVGIGAQSNRPMGIEGEEDIEGFLSGVEFLERCQTDPCELLNGKVIVIGGGNTAIDCARTSLRKGAEEVVLSYRRSRKEMPALGLEVDAAEEEGVELNLLTNPVRAIAGQDGRLKAIELIKMALGEPD